MTTTKTTMTKTPQEKHAQGYAYSKCCQAPTTTAGYKSPGSTCWYVCTDCRKPCDIFFRNSKPPKL